MLWYCRFKWYPQTSVAQVRKRVLEQDKAGTNQPEKIKGWYNLAGGGAGFMLVESDEHELGKTAPALHGSGQLGRTRRLRAGLREDDRRFQAGQWARRARTAIVTLSRRRPE